MNKFMGKYRIKSSRLETWDYSMPGYYFVTICTHNREYYFGNIINKKMILSEEGKIAQKYWLEISTHFKFVELDEFVVMPNHIHGILVINDHVRTPYVSVSSQKDKSGDVKWKSGTLGVIINQFKRVCTIHIRKFNPDFYWQPRYYDSIIWSPFGLERVRKYISKNPEKWEK